MIISSNQKISNSVIQSKIDYWHSQCQKYQFMIDINKYGIEYAIRLREPKYKFDTNGNKVYLTSTYGKTETNNLDLIIHVNSIIKEIITMNKHALKQKLNESIEVLKLWKREFYAFR